jgi:hypothetical protein
MKIDIKTFNSVAKTFVRRRIWPGLGLTELHQTIAKRSQRDKPVIGATTPPRDGDFAENLHL